MSLFAIESLDQSSRRCTRVRNGHRCFVLPHFASSGYRVLNVAIGLDGNSPDLKFYVLVSSHFRARYMGQGSEL